MALVIKINDLEDNWWQMSQTSVYFRWECMG